MSQQAMFNGLVFDEFGNQLETTIVGGEACYVVDDDGFRRHVEAQIVDRPVLELFIGQLQQNKDMAVGQALRLLGQDDLFTKAAVDASIDNISIDDVVGQGMPQQAREMMGMMGFRIVIDVHGEIVDIEFPVAPEDDE